jgi:hypothetical protein
VVVILSLVLISRTAVLSLVLVSGTDVLDLSSLIKNSVAGLELRSIRNLCYFIGKITTTLAHKKEVRLREEADFGRRRPWQATRGSCVFWGWDNASGESNF